ncbi:hypothetical protein RZN22_18095 [Bacillaceae bacterium S4-13-58]
MVSYILLLLGVFILSKQFHYSANMIGLKHVDVEKRTKMMRSRVTSLVLFLLILLLGIIYWGWSLKGDTFLIWSGIIFFIEFLFEKRAFRWRHFHLKGSWDTGIGVFLNLVRLGSVAAFFVWYL